MIKLFPIDVGTIDVRRCAVGLVALIACATAHADIYACSKGGVTVYQNFSCDLDSSGVGGPKTTTQIAPAANRAKATTARPGPTTQNVSTLGASAAPSEPRLGMSAAEVKSIWGEPSNVYHDELIDGRVEIWNYDAGRSVHFSPLGRAVAIERAGASGR